MSDMYNPSKAYVVANWYLNERIPNMLRFYKLPDTVKHRIWAYNAGIGCLRKGVLPDETQKYIAKYNKLT
jgi:hypothetical protein